jgi:hypothetical protein
MKTLITQTSKPETTMSYFGVEDTKGRKVGAAAVTYSVTYENSATGYLDRSEGTWYMLIVLETRDQKWFDSTRSRAVYKSEAERDAMVVLLVNNIGVEALTKFAA